MANCRFLEISRKTTFLNTQVQVIRFLKELHNVEISPITLLKSDSSSEALLAILKNRKTHRKYFRVESVFSIVIDNTLDSELYPIKTFFWKFCMTRFF